MGTCPGLAKLAYVLSRRPLYGIRADRRAGLVFCHAAALSARCARHADKAIATDPHSHADTFSYSDSHTHAHPAPDDHARSESHSKPYTHALAHAITDEYAIAISYPTDDCSMKKRFIRAERSAAKTKRASQNRLVYEANAY